MSEENESKWTFDEFKTKILTPSPLEARMTAITETAQVGITGVDPPNSDIFMRLKNVSIFENVSLFGESPIIEFFRKLFFRRFRDWETRRRFRLRDS